MWQLYEVHNVRWLLYITRCWRIPLAELSASAPRYRSGAEGMISTWYCCNMSNNCLIAKKLIRKANNSVKSRCQIWKIWTYEEIHMKVVSPRFLLGSQPIRIFWSCSMSNVSLSCKLQRTGWWCNMHSWSLSSTPQWSAKQTSRTKQRKSTSWQSSHRTLKLSNMSSERLTLMFRELLSNSDTFPWK